MCGEGLVVLYKFRGVRKACSFEFLGEVSLDRFNDLMRTVAVLLFISGVSACTCAHDCLLSLGGVFQPYNYMNIVAFRDVCAARH